MTTYLLATASVHTTAAACDYLGTRVAGDDTVTVLGVEGPDVSAQDIGDASNVATARLAPATVRTERRAGDPTTEVQAVATEIGADEIVVGRRRGSPEQRGHGLGTTAAGVAAGADRPVVIVPVDEP